MYPSALPRTRRSVRWDRRWPVSDGPAIVIGHIEPDGLQFTAISAARPPAPSTHARRRRWRCGGAAMSAPVHVTFFRDEYATTLASTQMTLPELRASILAATARSKAALPWLKLAVFGDKRTVNGSLRHDANVTAITGIELDYDAERLSLKDGAAIVKRAGLRALLYTSPSHRDAKPHWRVLLPTSRARPPGDRIKLARAVNELFGGVMAPESFILSQSYYFGAVNGNREHRAVIVAGDCVDVVLSDALKTNDNVIGFPKPKAELTAEFWRVARALAFVPNNDLPWKYWDNFGLAIHGATGDDGAPLFDAWSRRSCKYNKAYTAKTWAGFCRSPPDRIGAGTVCYMAHKFAPKWDERLDNGDAAARAVVAQFFELVEIAP
jgi:Primase C terminal 2 (PriCT-2)